MLPVLNQAPRWLFLLVLFYAPCAYGCTRPWTISLLNGLLGLVLVLWLTGCAWERRRPGVPLLLLLPIFWLLAQAWGMTWNAKFDCDPVTLEFSPRNPALGWAPGSIDRGSSFQMALRISLLLGALCFIADLAQDSRWRKRLVQTMVVAGSSLALFGLVQRMTGAAAIFWQAEETGSTFFATYRYHSNAGSLLNLVWPLALSLLVAALRRPGQTGLKVVWAGAVIACLTGLMVSGARAASLIALVCLALWAGWIARQIHRDDLPGVNLASGVVGGILVVVLLGAMAATAGLDLAAHRWNKTGELLSAENPRLLVYQACWRMVPEAGWFGFGPGTFRLAFPYFTEEYGERISGVWRYAHQDYLQGLIEWGYWGTMAGALCLMGGWSCAKRRLAPAPPLRFRERALWLGVWTAMAGVLLHMMMDFPFQIASIQLYVAVLAGMLWSRCGRGGVHLPK